MLSESHQNHHSHPSSIPNFERFWARGGSDDITFLLKHTDAFRCPVQCQQIRYEPYLHLSSELFFCFHIMWFILVREEKRSEGIF